MKLKPRSKSYPKMQNGDRVRVWPHGQDEKAAEGTIKIISENQRSICVLFDHLPPFATMADGFGITPEGIAFVAIAHHIGPWVELFGHGQFEIEPATRSI